MKPTIIALAVITSLALSTCKVQDGAAKGPSNAANVIIRGGLVRQVDYSVLPRDSEQCGRWTYSEKNLGVDFSRMREVISGDWGRLCYTYACSYTGSATYQAKTYRIEVNAGGWIVLSSSEGLPSRFFISDATLPSFLDSCDCCEE